jgi:hypothetical protein
METIQVLVEDELYRRVHRVASERGISVSALVVQLLSGLDTAPDTAERLKRQEEALRGEITSFRVSDRVSREELHERGTG